MPIKKFCLTTSIVPILVVSAILMLVVFTLAQWVSSQKTAAPAQDSMASQIRQQLYDHQVVPLQVGEQRLWVEVVTTPASITQGLSERTAIGVPPAESALPSSPSQGMLFVFAEPRIPSFWMKDMQFDLDLIWINEGKIVEITQNVPKPTSNQQQLPTYSPQQAVNMVLEVPAGSVQAWNLEVGHSLFFPTLLTDDPGQK